MEVITEAQHVLEIKEAIKTLNWVLENTKPISPELQSDLFNMVCNSKTSLESLINCRHPKETLVISREHLQCSKCLKVIDLDDILKHFD